MAREKKGITPKPVLFIACEGTNTEFDYFSSWAITDKALELFEAINVYPGEDDDNPKTNPYQLFGIAKKQLDDGAANFSWSVFDRDGHPKLPETFSESLSAGVRIAFSSRSFEQWVMMHFAKVNLIHNASECKNEKDHPIGCGTSAVPNCTPIPCLSGHIRRQGYITGYSKKKDFDLFTAINPHIEKALVNTAWLRFQVSASLYQTQPLLHTLNPYTDVDQLILLLLGRTDKIIWGISGHNINFANWNINICVSSGNLLLVISHTKPQALLLNSAFTSSSFYSTDDDLNDNICNAISSRFILNNNGSTERLLSPNDVIEYTLEYNGQPYFLFKEDSKAIRIYLTL